MPKCAALRGRREIMFRVFTMIRYLIIFKITKECVSSYIFFKISFFYLFLSADEVANMC